MDNLLTYGLLFASLAVPIFLEKWSQARGLGRDSNQLESLSQRLLQALISMLLLCYLIGVLTLGTFTNLMIVIQLCLMSAVFWIPATIISFLVMSKKPGSTKGGPHAPTD